MALSESDVRTIADYARIGLTPDELSEMSAYLNEAMEMIAPVLQYGSANVAPTFHPIGDLSNVMGTDRVQPGLGIDTALSDAASTQGRYFRVPSILGDGGEA